jgi:hypothetical protein
MLWLGEGENRQGFFRSIQIAVPDTLLEARLTDIQVICIYKCVLAALRLPVFFGSLTSNPPSPAQSQLRWSSLHDI